MGADHGFGDLVPRGTGPRATVYAGIRAATGEAVALKVFRAKLPRRTRAEVERELARVARLNVPAVLVADGLEDFGDRTALRMELCTQSLTDVVEQEGPLPIADVIALGSTLAEALAVAHEAGVVHGGVTPGNVLFRPSGEPVLADFGVTLRLVFPHEGGDGVDFLAPETLEHGTADERSDLYGLGAVLHLALSGLSPHPARLGEHPDDRKLRVLGSTVPRPDRADLPDELAELVRALLAKDPAIRPSSMRDVATWLGRLSAADRPAAPQRPPVPGGAPVFISAPDTTTRKHPAVPVLAGAAGLLVVVTVGVLLMRSDPQVRGEGPVSASPTSAKTVVLQLAEPVDNVSHVDLRWESPEQLEFAVVVAGEGEKPKVVRVQQNRSLKVEVDPTRKYCFLVQGTDGNHVYESKPKPVRNATCKR
ncbi:serine/threonine protein kinase [Lentzea atacamensis]|uniref:non-specific serine/threonine protein kinase n=1 Tax=Lentzea atacamensis TaxID=531938 RepID=A0A316HRG6_9PSEU|nr:serine/threonine-protein kinase [Lentzea atacamensis]PWK83257.1 serine/threonine protein kinase [Lentzea atacamensis]